ncbi:alpha/beta fold hydrolase [Nesterenkonia sp. E16_7]|uniref:alpha/beta hydrolase n=1 Tax=unclassified Nesterenkonia TaxID=2629769 RepID=UPI001A916E02|nr:MULTISPECIES: alpha/beta fold hydrolase [unclassified Nesterenkonia]MBO0595090.1 alpha/beta fold hydrolase [Nesterenkonia sp. E16_10]MBO0598745.1 alpha/beta fold hydrolase [Nesterenkonia sp. E16_7]
MDMSGFGVSVFHGFTSTPASMRPLADALERAGFTVDLPLLPGHGTCWEDLAGTPRSQIMRAALASYDRLAARCSRVATVGLSMGGSLALHVAAHRQVDAVSVINPGLRLAPLTGPKAWVLGRIRPSVASIAGDIAKPDVVEEAYAQTPLRAVVQLDQLFAQVRRELPELARRQTPVLLFRSGVDNVLPPSSAATLGRTLSEDQLEIVELTRSQHVATLDHEAETIHEQLIDFLHRRHQAAGPPERMAP